MHPHTQSHEFHQHRQSADHCLQKLLARHQVAAKVVTHRPAEVVVPHLPMVWEDPHPVLDQESPHQAQAEAVLEYRPTQATVDVPDPADLLIQASRPAESIPLLPHCQEEQVLALLEA